MFMLNKLFESESESILYMYSIYSSSPTRSPPPPPQTPVNGIQFQEAIFN